MRFRKVVCAHTQVVYLFGEVEFLLLETSTYYAPDYKGWFESVIKAK